MTGDLRRPDWWAARDIYKRKGLKVSMGYQRVPYVDAIKYAFPQAQPELRYWPLPFPEIVVQPHLYALVWWQYDTVETVGGEFALWDDQNFDANWHRFSIPKSADIPNIIYMQKPKHWTKEETNWVTGLVNLSVFILGELRNDAGSVCYAAETRRRQSAHSACRNEKKPWLREDLPSIVLLDPNKPKTFREHTTPIGTHASPTPHQRLGHYANLRSEKFKNKKGQRIWRKGTWVGDEEWVFNGRHYKLLKGNENDKMA